VVLDNALADGEANAAARILDTVMQALKNDEDALEEALFDTDAIVLNMHGGYAVGIDFGADTNDRCSTGLVILERIADQVLQQGAHLHRLAKDNRQRAAFECCARLRYRLAEVLRQQRVYTLQVHRPQIALAAADA